MPTISRVIRTSDQICTDIEQIFGFVPPFFEPARSTPQVLESLWQMTLLADIDSSLPRRFRQRLNVSLARFCAIPYCMICHASALRPLDITGREILALLEAPLPLGSEVGAHLVNLNASPSHLSTFPDSESPQELALIACAAVIFSRGSQEAACQECIERTLGSELFNSLSLYLAYLKTCHTWLEMHPDISYETDEQLQGCLGPLLAESPALSDFFRNCRGKVNMFHFSRGERKIAIEIKQASERSHEILESITDAFYSLDHEWRFTYVNAAAERVLQRTREELLGEYAWDEFPEWVGTTYYHLYHRVMGEKIALSHEDYYEPLDAWVEMRVFPSADGISVFFQNINARKTSEERLRHSEERYRLMVEGAKDYAMILIDTAGCITGWNMGAERIMGWTEAEVMGRRVDLIFLPEDRKAGIGAQKMNTAAAEGQASDSRWLIKKDGLAFYSEATLECLRDDEGKLRGFVKILRDVTEAKRAQDALRESEERLRVTQAKLETVLSAGKVGTWSWDLVNNRIFADAEFARLYSLSPEDAAGGPHEACYKVIHPDDLPRMSKAVSESLAHQDIYEVEYRVVLPDGMHRWVTARGKVERNAESAATTLSGLVVDVTERVEREQREKLLAKIADQARTITDPAEVIADAMRSVGEFLGVSRCLYADIDIEADICSIPFDYCADASVASMVGAFPISAYGPRLVAAFAAGRTFSVHDTHAETNRLGAKYLAAYDAIGCRALIAAPFVRADRLVSVVSVHCAVPRQWKPEEIQLIQNIVERTWMNVEITRQERARRREANELQQAGERTQAILESISDAFYALDAEWRFTYLNTQAESLLHRTREELVGKNIWTEFPERVGTKLHQLYLQAADTGTMQAFEEYSVLLSAWFEVRAYPAADGVSIYLHDISERKALEAERERLAEHERNIAYQLQTALTPALPEHIPGLAVTKYYEAALDEAGVGGDFYDVFEVGKGCTALVVGDLSGKGLAAASEVAMVRNMLRYSVFRSRSLVGALTSLNTLLADQHLLSGFATLFVGTYNTQTGLFTYVNCGQEPALVRRGSGMVEFLEATGPVLGTFPEMTYTEQTVALRPGDAVILFTDGLTEVGRSRSKMIGVEGVAGLVESFSAVPRPSDADPTRPSDAEAQAEALALHLIAGVDAAAKGGFMRDDVCLLIGVVRE